MQGVRAVGRVAQPEHRHAVALLHRKQDGGDARGGVVGVSVVRALPAVLQLVQALARAVRHLRHKVQRLNGPVVTQHLRTRTAENSCWEPKCTRRELMVDQNVCEAAPDISIGRASKHP